MERKKTYYPACVIAVLTVVLFGIVNICQLYCLKDSYPVAKIWVGSDYICFYNATQNLLNGVSLYENIWHTIPDYLKQLFASSNIILYGSRAESWYCFPPLAAYLNYPLVYFEMDTASNIIFSLLIVVVFISFILINNSFPSIEFKERKRIFLCGAMIILLSYPFYYLIVRGHMIGIAFLLIAMGIYLFQRENALCSVCFGLSIGLMVFPALILVPLLIFRRYKIIVFTVLTLALIMVLSPDVWIEYIRGPLLDRFLFSKGGGYVSTNQNCSLASAFNFFTIALNSFFARIGMPTFHRGGVGGTALIAYALMLCIMILSDLRVMKKNSCLDREIETVLIIMYFPFMIAIPNTVFPYNLVLLILMVPALCALMLKLKKPLPRIVFWMLVAGIFLSQLQVQTMQNLINLQPAFFHFFSGFGLFMVMLGCVLFKLWLWRKYKGSLTVPDCLP